MVNNAATDLIIRPARADDLDAIPLVYSSGPAVWDALFGDGTPASSLDYLRMEWQRGTGVAGHRWHWVAERNGDILGAVAVYDRKGDAQRGQQTTLNALRYFGVGLLPRLPRLLRVGKSLMQSPAVGVDYVANFGVAEAARGQGIGSTMLSYFLAQAKQRGQRYYELDVALDNPRGQALYERFGMVVVAENHDAHLQKLGISGTRRMRMPV